jgi:UDP-N-acetylmuramate dehydrogenase
MTRNLIDKRSNFKTINLKYLNEEPKRNQDSSSKKSIFVLIIEVMITLLENYSLKNHNFFKVEAKAMYFAECDTVSDLVNFIRHRPYDDLPVMVIGEGSNVLFQSDYNGLIIHPVIRGIDILHEDNTGIIVRAGAGENWDSFVKWAVEKRYGGIENLSLIPGSIGACPIQNIGAYGAEVSQVIESVETIDFLDGTSTTYSSSECSFSYRNSIFKGDLKGKKIITNVIFRLSKSPVLITGYGVISERLKKYKKIDTNTLRKVVIDIRRKKLPDPAKIANAGSFFKNPVVSDKEFGMILSRFPDLPHFQAEDAGCRKIPAAWLIEKCGWKGKRIGDTGTWPAQPLVLVNYGRATGQDILKLSEKITEDVLEKFGIRLEREVSVV